MAEILKIGGLEFEVSFKTINGFMVRNVKTGELVYKNALVVATARRLKNEILEKTKGD